MSFLIIIFQIIVVLFSVVLHEVSHGLVANSLGDSTAKDQGRLTLNPIKHLDLFGSVLLPILFILSSGGSFIFGYAKPVPYNPLNLNDKRTGVIKVALAGPLSNILLAVLFGLLLRFLPASESFKGGLFLILVASIVRLNLVLALFNLMPIPPLDGHWLLFSLLPSRYDSIKLFLLRYNLFIFVIFIFFIFPLFYPLINLLFKLIVGVG